MRFKFILIVISFLLLAGCSHSIRMREIPLDSNNFSTLSTSDKQTLPLILQQYQLLSDGVDSPMDEGHVEFTLNKLRKSGLFSEVVRNQSIQNYDTYITLSFTSNENMDRHKVSNMAKAFAMYFLYLPAAFLHFKYDYVDEYIFTFNRWDGETRQFSAKASAQLKLDMWADITVGSSELGNQVRTSIFNSIVNQMQNDSNFFHLKMDNSLDIID